jgi:hypothetical protein
MLAARRIGATAVFLGNLRALDEVAGVRWADSALSAARLVVDD